MSNIYDDDYLTGGADALAALGNRIGLYLSDGSRVGPTSGSVIYADTTWGAAALSGTGGARVATKIGSKVTITVPGGTVANGAVISHYGIHNGTTRLRRVDLKPLTATVSDGSQAFTIDVTPTLVFDGVE
ncbi:hypothetical protein EF294_15750 [Gordonia oryzae]|uniref:Uncharacterized protein n=1 Tax=Gordonia oryzae TaxID=2487349 RepID=A0A3N4G779_9ACTN|nr:hypothetical protein [Gordonia oryzae]RPA58609.1 hypothetical protein EF294_15750 [Gordonia oryzae]